MINVLNHKGIIYVIDLMFHEERKGYHIFFDSKVLCVMRYVSFSVKWIIDLITILPTLQKQYIQGLSDIFGMNISSPSFSHLLILPIKKENNFVMVTIIYVLTLTPYIPIF